MVIAADAISTTQTLAGLKYQPQSPVVVDGVAAVHCTIDGAFITLTGNAKSVLVVPCPRIFVTLSVHALRLRS